MDLQSLDIIISAIQLMSICKSKSSLNIKPLTMQTGCNTPAKCRHALLSLLPLSNEEEGDQSAEPGAANKSAALFIILLHHRP